MDTMQSNFSLAKAKEEREEEVANPLPRAVRRRNAFTLLDGEWKFEIDYNDVGLKENWSQAHNYRNTALWPGSVEAHMAAAKDNQDSVARPENVIAWYEREFDLPPVAERPEGTMIQLTFGACGYETQVWMNGFPLKTVEGEPIHYGEYTSFSFELEEEVLQTRNRLTVRIVDTFSADVPRGKQESHVYKRGGIWYQTYSGAVRSIWIESVERNRLRSRVSVVSIVEDKLIRFNLMSRIHDAGQYTIRLIVSENKGNGEPLATADFPLRLEAGQKRQRLVIDLPEAELWSPDNPHLYRLVAQLIDEKGHKSQIETHFGLRKIESRGCCVYLNNKAVYLDGILYQPGTATYEEIRSHMYSMKELGCNLVRIHIAGVDPRIYALADELGLLLWVEVPSPHSSNQQSRANHFAELKRMLDLIETHPSVIIWSLYNEDWGAQDIATNEDTRKYIVDTYHYMMIHHPQFLVVDNDGWQHISLEGRLKSDLLSAHLYTPDLEHWKQLLDKLCVGDELDKVAAFPLVVGDPFFFRNQVPLVVSEWGGFGFADYGGPTDVSARADRIKLFKDELRKRPIAGDVYTQATNIEDERNGLIDAATGNLMVPAGLLASRHIAPPVGGSNCVSAKQVQ